MKLHPWKALKMKAGGAYKFFSDLRDKGDTNLYIAAAGGASDLQGSALLVPGASSYLVGAELLYSTHTFDRFIGHTPRNYCSQYAAIELAISAFIRAKMDCAYDLKVKPKKSIGLGIACALTAFKHRRGENRVHAAVVSDYGCYIVSLTLPKEEDPNLSVDDRFYARIGENHDCDDLGLELLDFIVNGGDFKADKIEDTELLEHIMDRPTFVFDGRRCPAPEVKAAQDNIMLYPGSFNPAHEGHKRTAESVIEAGFAGEVIPYITIDPPHKAPIKPIDLLTRISYLKVQLPTNTVLVSKGDPLFVDKAARWPGVTMVMGSDTLNNVMDPKYGLSPEEVCRQFNTHKTFLIVVKRPGHEYRIDLKPLDTPVQYLTGYNNLETSSTQIRKGWEPCEECHVIGNHKMDCGRNR